jgi:TRAP-type mannitol/chloroaromatic compound transport system permease small subunit
MNKLGNILAVFVLLMIGLSFSLVIVHLLFNLVFIPVQELIIYLHSSVFMLGIVYAFHHDKHVRIDIFYQNYHSKRKNQLELLGSILLLMPFFLFITYASYGYVYSSWSKLEGSGESGGLPLVFVLKTLILILPLSMIAYSIHKMMRNK